MILAKETIKHLAELARLSLKPSEVKRYCVELGSVLDYVGQLSEVDTSQIKLTAANSLSNVWREDDPVIWPEGEVNLAKYQAGESEAGGIKVKRVLI
ncbi:MAG TPA: Asp-tRNA(Asn)/Glu-tRNA(Gln) amidotransferase subunit GatC [bacterium]|nr:Asp-tRNA(Asn)/Glu-tRNA(Gln) amidotransferase subunit GatC [bacterium]HPT29794.1 Asp-tRNA(Asn)/Glu-tRNA(Gln) amidotransferase subunit GatC [bacterium]